MCMTDVYEIYMQIYIFIELKLDKNFLPFHFWHIQKFMF